MKDEDWANNWKKYYTAFKISDRVAVCPSWIDPATIDSEYKIILDPGSAFGTGTHETTSMCAEILDKYLPAGADVLDLGTGSGILAIIAKLLGAGRIEAVDIDSLAVRVAEDNCRINGCEDIDCYTGELKSVKRSDYDVIVANIIADIIEPLYDDENADLEALKEKFLDDLEEYECEEFDCDPEDDAYIRHRKVMSQTITAFVAYFTLD